MRSSTLSGVSLRPVAPNRQDLDCRHITPVSIELVGELEMNGRYTHSISAEPYADDDRKP